VIHVDIAAFDKITDEKLVENLYLLAQQAFENIMRDKKANEQVAATLYSLFKQIRDGNADEFEKNKENTKPERYAVWLQQVDKDADRCMKEYVLLVG